MFNQADLQALIYDTEQTTLDTINYTVEVANFTQMLGERKTALQNDIAVATMDGRIAGKNADERAAVARQMFAEEFATVEELEGSLAQAKCDLTIAGHEMDALKMKLRVYELFARVLPE